MNKETPENDTCMQKCIKCIKWTGKVSKVVAIVSVLMSIGFGIYNTINPDARHFNSDTSHNFNMRLNENKKFTQKCLFQGPCMLECRDINEEQRGESVAMHINASLTNKHCADVTLKIRNIKFKQHQLTSSWLANATVKIKELIIEESALSAINKHAFARHPFNGSLRHLKIISSDLEILKKRILLGVNTFNFKLFNYSRNLKIEGKALTGIANTIESLNLHGFRLTPEHIINLTGNRAARLPKLQILDLNNNFLPELAKYSFINVPNVKSLYLQNIGLKKIDPKAFWGANLIKRLDLTFNDLDTLPYGIFFNLTNLNLGGVQLWGNKWNCNCSLDWLKRYYSRTNYINKLKPLLCSVGKMIDEVEFCPSSEIL